MQRDLSLSPEKELPPWKRRKIQTQSLQIVGLTGTIGSGKGTAAEFLVAQGFQHVRIRDVLAQAVEQSGGTSHPDQFVSWAPTALARPIYSGSSARA
ncbi:unnamed protein product [Cladocopium goreaui]|uniref:Dephospho-CoA kinase n=1 Tax=Cladocopium goreaui TaxID=2562237 RepID=A0A9P1FRV5_9DINO|nr:unnamed protein product [Cladocopium goreaui]